MLGFTLLPTQIRSRTVAKIDFENNSATYTTTTNTTAAANSANSANTYNLPLCV